MDKRKATDPEVEDKTDSATAAPVPKKARSKYDEPPPSDSESDSEGDEESEFDEEDVNESELEDELEDLSEPEVEPSSRRTRASKVDYQQLSKEVDGDDKEEDEEDFVDKKDESSKD